MLLIFVLGVLFLLASGGSALAQWSVEGGVNTFYTDDVSIFSASQRLELREDPTQPVIDVTDQGDDIVFEPLLSVGRSFQLPWGTTKITGKAQGFVFTKNPLFDHGTYGVRISQELPANFLLAFRYHYGPNQFLGVNEESRTENESLVEERVTTHFWVMELEREFTETLTLRLLGRYGLRFYNDTFAQRDTKFWTVGPHLEWAIHPRIDLALGYHFERGLADGRNEPQFNDDISYLNHYVSLELGIRVTDRTSLTFGFDYERNDFTSDFIDDVHRDGNENIFQGEVEIRHTLIKALDLTLGYQRGQRKFSFEPTLAFVNSVWIGGTYRF